MEVFYGIIGLVAIYFWVHAIVIAIRNNKKRTQYETVVLITACVLLGLWILGTLM
jgi:hypothetical protein